MSLSVSALKGISKKDHISELDSREVIYSIGVLFQNQGLPEHSACAFHIAEKLKRQGIEAEKPVQQDVMTEPVTASSILSTGAQHLKDRGVTYDAPGGERSMGKTVQMFNAYSGLNVTEEQGWAFMAMLKLVRTSQGEYKGDNFEDGAAYFALMGEAAFNANRLSNAVGVISEKARKGESMLSPE